MLAGVRGRAVLVLAEVGGTQRRDEANETRFAKVVGSLGSKAGGQAPDAAVDARS